MEKMQEILLAALKQGMAEPGEQRLYRSGKLPGLFAGRTSFNAQAASQAVAEGLLEIVRTETKGKTPVEWVRVTPRGAEFLLQHESPAGILEELQQCLAANHAGIPHWVAEMQRTLDEVQRRFVDEMQRIRVRLDQMSQRVADALRKMEPPLAAGAAGALAWDQDAVSYLKRRQEVGIGEKCPLPELFNTLRERHEDLTIREFHSGLRRLHDRGAIRLFTCDDPDGPPEPEYSLLDGATMYYYAAS